MFEASLKDDKIRRRFNRSSCGHACEEEILIFNSIVYKRFLLFVRVPELFYFQIIRIKFLENILRRRNEAYEGTKSL